jgi:hypothetical protein
MYAAIRRYKFDTKNAETINKSVHEGFLPLISKARGFIAYYWMNVEPGVGLSLSVFNTKGEADESVRLAHDYVQEHLAKVLGAPEVTETEVLTYGHK